MGKSEIEALFKFLKTISEKMEEQNIEIRNLNLKFAILERNFETLAEKVDGMLDRCKTNETDIKKAGDFMLIHDTKEKSILGIRTDFIAWVGLLAALVAIAVNVNKLAQ